jgi:hypothetical protein
MAAIVRQRPTRRQLEVLRAHIVAGSIAIAAHEVAPRTDPDRGTSARRPALPG